jgi:hypothetical protein
MVLFVDKKVRFYEPYRRSQVRWGVIVDVEERPAPLGKQPWVRAR